MSARSRIGPARRNGGCGIGSGEDDSASCEYVSAFEADSTRKRAGTDEGCTSVECARVERCEPGENTGCYARQSHQQGG